MGRKSISFLLYAKRKTSQETIAIKILTFMNKSRVKLKVYICLSNLKHMFEDYTFYLSAFSIPLFNPLKKC